MIGRKSGGGGGGRLDQPREDGCGMVCVIMMVTTPQYVWAGQICLGQSPDETEMFLDSDCSSSILVAVICGSVRGSVRLVPFPAGRGWCVCVGKGGRWTMLVGSSASLSFFFFWHTTLRFVRSISCPLRGLQLLLVVHSPNASGCYVDEASCRRRWKAG